MMMPGKDRSTRGRPGFRFAHQGRRTRDLTRLQRSRILATLKLKGFHLEAAILSLVEDDALRRAFIRLFFPCAGTAGCNNQRPQGGRIGRVAG